ncbi:acyl-coenzyme A diphosphatase FITM2 [Schistocerca americana]|uniref:acyl-coenzyme A diphosphatase FITM2 n=1 Tax=Schistocerca americana TaxID=7009 RepID=UPI001F50070D|nr:acyl-coenzyme A diphosphatase FITM2 [Schistocerca americana]XP_049957102.1 acyl-coenzyme A diphosphatase FITM2 [Schistocerca serialis cubense]
MATRRRPLHQNAGSRLNFRPQESYSFEAKGRKPLPEPSSICNVLLMMVLHVCRKTLFVDTSIKVAVYGGCLFLLSLIADILPFPRSYFSSSANVFNVYFVKLGWGWTLLVAFPFLILTSYTYCCGKRELVLKHLMRLGISTCCWFFWVNTFSYIESNYGRCNPKKHSSKSVCLGAGGSWYGFDLSGHAFILIYSNLVLIEEARAIIGWEGIRDLIRNEEHARSNSDASVSNSPLRLLTEVEFLRLKESYQKFTPYIRSLFIGMTTLSVLWDIMLVSTILYYHIMIEKFISGAIAILMWFVTYRYLYALMRNLPGEGLFKYRDLNINRSVPLNKRSSSTSVKNDIPRFMGMPLYAARNVEEESQQNEDQSSAVKTQL